MAINMMCTNSNCKYYWEDNCTRNMNEERIEINEAGKCETFEEGVSEWYKAMEDGENNRPTSTRSDILQLAVDIYGRPAQVDMMIEEMSELTKALLKERRVPPFPVDGLKVAIMNIREEMADVQIMLDQMKIIYGDPADVEAKKVERLAERLGERGDSDGEES